jgi:hypothetical protein
LAGIDILEKTLRAGFAAQVQGRKEEKEEREMAKN